MVISQITLMLLRNFFYIMLTCHWQVPGRGREGRCAGHVKGGSRRYQQAGAGAAGQHAGGAAGAREGQGRGFVWDVQQWEGDELLGRGAP